jgi:hypothetical protein
MPVKRVKSTAKKGRTKSVLYPILIECSAIVKDDFWRQFYEDLAAGKSTKGVYILNGILQTSNKRNGFSYSITDKAPEVIVKELHYLLTTHTGICSKKDMNKKRKIIEDISTELEAYDKGKWTSIKRKNVKNMLIVNYVIYLHKTYDLSWPATLNAYDTIMLAFESKTHSSKDVVYEDGKIKDIIDIEISDDNTHIVNTRSDQESLSVEETESNSSAIMLQELFESYISNWIKYLQA